jgi:hypothetical protein
LAKFRRIGLRLVPPCPFKEVADLQRFWISEDFKAFATPTRTPGLTLDEVEF